MAAKTVHLSVRIPAQLAENLDDLAARLRVSRSQAAIRVLEEGSRMARFAGIDFRNGHLGRSPFITGTGLAVWELYMIWSDHGRSVKRLLRYYPNLSPARIEAGRRYIEAYPDEIEEELARAQRTQQIR